MKKSELTFMDGFMSNRAEQARLAGVTHKAFDWDKAAEIIKARFSEHHDLLAEAGLQQDWNYTGGEIFRDGKPINDSYTYLASNWAMPTLILSWDGQEQEEIECFAETNDRFNSETKWDNKSLEILGISL